MKFGDYIRQKRESAGWAQPEAAAKIDIEQSYLSKLETGKSYPSNDIFRRLEAAYSLDMDDMGRKVFSAELDKLREISSVRALVLARQTSETKYLRSWLAAGMAMLMLGSGFVVYESNQGLKGKSINKYESPGIIREGEPVQIFARLAEREEVRDHLRLNILMGDSTAELPDENLGESYSDRLSYDLLNLEENLGPVFVKQVPGGRRRYEFKVHVSYEYSTRNNARFALGVALVMGSFACFYISRRWR